MFEDYYMTADDVAKALKISKSFAYKQIDNLLEQARANKGKRRDERSR